MSKLEQPAQHQQHQPGVEGKMRPEPEFMPRYPGSGRLKDKVAIITGADSGIGRATAVLFAREGAKVAFLYKEEDEDARVTEEHIRQEGSESFSMRGDIADLELIKSLVAKTMEKWGRIDVLVNNAAEQHEQYKLEDLPEEQMRRTFETNIFGLILMTREVIRHMKKGASIINMTSITAYRGKPELVDYASTKGAILAFTRSMAAQVAERGIRVNGVAPGPIWTPLIPASFTDEEVKDFGSGTPMKRPGQPNEVAPAILFLACEDASYMSGQVLHPNGGSPTES